MAPATHERVAGFAALFDAVGVRGAAANLFVYHAELPPGERIEYPDVTMDVQRFDHAAVLEHLIERKRRYVPGAHLILATAPGSVLRRLAAEDVSVVELPVELEHPMYMRALAMLAYVKSSAFDANTAFLDSDALPNGPLDPVFALRFDVALTYRSDLGLMPVNEGVIFARGAVEWFFAQVVTMYDVVAADPLVTGHYGNVRRWRGGQLSLNAVVHRFAPFSPYRRERLGETTLRFLPCDSFNYSWDYARHPDAAEFAGRTIIHLKGGRKDALEVLRAAMAPANPLSADRLYSLDTTPPVDYEPDQSIDYASASLTQIADHFKTDKGSIKHRYTDTYERYLAPLRGKPVRLIEIGVACGASLKTWARWLGEEARITGIDIRPECAALCTQYPSVSIVVGDATAFQPDGDYDIVVDDGSHVSLEIVKTFRNLWPRLRPGGYYVVEDLRCTHDPLYARSFPFRMAPDSFRREHLMAWMDQLLRRMDYEASDVEFIHAYPQMLVLRKR